jgi:hypothetical protein
MANFSKLGSNISSNISSVGNFFGNVGNALNSARRGIQGATQNTPNYSSLPKPGEVVAKPTTQYSVPAGPVAVPRPQTNFTAPTQAPTNFQYPQAQASTSSNEMIAGIQAQLESAQALLKERQAEEAKTAKPDSLTSAETEQKGFFDQIKQSAKDILGIKNKVSGLDSELGIGDMTKKIKENNLAMADAMARYKQATQNIEGKPIPMEDINLEKERVSRIYATEIGVLDAYGNALQGNLKLAYDRIDQVIQNELEPATQELDNLKLFYDMNSDVLSRERADYKSQLDAVIKERESANKTMEENAKANAQLVKSIFESGNSIPKGFDFKADYQENLMKYGGGLKNVTKDSESGVGSTTKSLVTQAFDSMVGSDGFVSPEDWLYAKKEWVRKGGTSASFDTAFGVYKNPEDTYN